MENKPQELQAHVFVPQQLLQLLANLMAPLMCCPTKTGIQEKVVYFLEQKTYCEDCFKVAAEKIQAEKELKAGEDALHQ